MKIRTKTKKKEQTFDSKRNYCHFILKGIAASLHNLDVNDATTLEESHELLALRREVEEFSKKFFLDSSRRKAEVHYNKN